MEGTTAAFHVEQHKATLAWSGPEMPSDEERARAAAEVSALGHELDGLAAAAQAKQGAKREPEPTRKLAAASRRKRKAA